MGFLSEKTPESFQYLMCKKDFGVYCFFLFFVSSLLSFHFLLPDGFQIVSVNPDASVHPLHLCIQFEFPVGFSNHMANPIRSVCHGGNFMSLRVIEDKFQPFLPQVLDLLLSILVIVPLTGLKSSFAMQGQLFVG